MLEYIFVMGPYRMHNHKPWLYHSDQTYIYIKFENTKGLIRSRRPKKNRQCSGQNREIQKTNNDLQNTTEETKD